MELKSKSAVFIKIDKYLINNSNRNSSNASSNCTQFEVTETAADNTGTDTEKYEINAEWTVPLKGSICRIQLEHGSVSGRRIVRLDGKEIFRKDWMFKLVGDDVFYIDNIPCVIRVDPAPNFKFCYSLFIDGKPYLEFNEKQAKDLNIWETVTNEKSYRIILENKSLNLFLNGELRDEVAEFVDNGTETTFIVDDNVFVLSANLIGGGSSKHKGLTYTLTINGIEITESENL